MNIHVLNMITGKNQSVIWMKDMSWECKCKTDERKHSSNQSGRIMINVDASVKNIIYVKKVMLEILLHVLMKMENI